MANWDLDNYNIIYEPTYPSGTTEDVGTFSSARTVDNRGLDGVSATYQIQVATSTPSGKLSLGSFDFSNGVFVAHVGHNSPYRNFGKGYWYFEDSLGNYSEYDTFDVNNNPDPSTIGHRINLNATPSRSSGVLDITDIAKYGYLESRLTTSSSSIIYTSFQTLISNIQDSLSITKVYGDSLIEDFLVGVNNAQYGTQYRHIDAYNLTSTGVFLSAPIQFGKIGEVTTITMSNNFLEVEPYNANNPMTYITDEPVLVGSWQDGDSLVFDNKTIGFAGTDTNLFDFDNALIDLQLQDVLIKEIGDARLGTSVNSDKMTISIANSKTLTSNISLDNFIITGGTVVQENSTLSLADAEIEYYRLDSGTTNFEFDNCTIGTFENNSGNDISMFLSNGSTVGTIIETNGTVSNALFITIEDLQGDDLTITAADTNNIGVPIFEGTALSNIVIDVSEVVGDLIFTVDKPEYYANTFVHTIVSSETITVSLNKAVNVDESEDISDFINNHTENVSIDKFGTFDVVEVVINTDLVYSIAQWCRVHDYMTEKLEFLRILNASGIGAEVVFETNASGVIMKAPSIQVFAGAGYDVKVKANIDESQAQLIAPTYEYAPKNLPTTENRVITSIDPLINDYDLIRTINTEENKKVINTIYPLY